MPPLSLIILYVDSPAASADFYRRVLDHEPAEQSPCSPSPVALALDYGPARHAVLPAPAAEGGATELAFM